MKNFTSVKDIQSVDELVQLAAKMKENPFAFERLGVRRTLGLIFFNPSLRTRMSTQKAARNLGLDVMVMNFNSDGWQLETREGAVMDGGSQEHISEAAGVLSAYCDIIGIRSFAKLQNREEDYAESILNGFVQHAKVPVISLESATLHPLQSLADMLTIAEHRLKPNPKIVLSWAPHPKPLPQAVANSFAEWSIAAGHDLIITHPPGYELASSFAKGAHVTHNQDEALKDADFVYVKNWSQYANYGQSSKDFSSWMMTEEKMALTNDGRFMHCLPLRRNVIASDSVIDAKTSLIFQQAENRIYSAQAVLYKMLSHEG